ncbi:MAG: 2-oxoacid:acceptor oxidoreductase subunit alpha [Betaproteobacteria bacterium]|nr:2-oxoacid:acceptor oxidoreductase subunit alpha [Betaproteobacteria bacterium]
MDKNDLIIRVAGEGGEGVISTGDLITQACARAGLEVYTFKTFPAEIKGGYAMYQSRASTEPLYNQGDTFDVLCAFNGQAYDLNRSRLLPGTAFVYDGPGGDFEPDVPPGVHAYPIPMTVAAKELGGIRVKNMIALGALSQLFNVPDLPLQEIITAKFAKKGPEVVEKNLTAFARGRELAAALPKTDPWKIGVPTKKSDSIVLSGNDAVGLGAIIAGLDFFAAYPITPATEIARYVARHLPKRGGTLIQAEDEIASISQVLGASFAGKKAMTATSGPGLALMGEMLGMSFMSETPSVVVNVQRGGPSTGLPTKHEQSDLFLSIFGSHGDCGRIVLSVEGVEDCIGLTVEAFNLAETYQCPVLLLSDGSLAFSTQTIPYPDPASYKLVSRKRWDGKKAYQRYAITDDFISPMADPGTPGGMHIATGLEHDQAGEPSYTAANHEAMQAKRFRKLDAVVKNFAPVEVDGEGESDLGIIAWGSTIGVVREAIARLRAEGVSVKGFYPKLMWPMPVEQYEAFGASCRKTVVAEVNFLGQLAHFIRAETNLRPESYTICGGLPFTPAMIVGKAKEMLK